MPQSLHDQISALTTTLAQTNNLDARARELLPELVKQIARLNEPHDVSVIDRLEAIAIRFEQDHPTAGTALRQAIDALSKAGI